MKKHIYDAEGMQLLRVVEAEPECGEDFCDGCGDCLYCFGDDPCYSALADDSNEHVWVQYGEDDA